MTLSVLLGNFRVQAHSKPQPDYLLTQLGTYKITQYITHLLTQHQHIDYTHQTHQTTTNNSKQSSPLEITWKIESTAQNCQLQGMTVNPSPPWRSSPHLSQSLSHKPVTLLTPGREVYLGDHDGRLITIQMPISSLRCMTTESSHLWCPSPLYKL